MELRDYRVYKKTKFVMNLKKIFLFLFHICLFNDAIYLAKLTFMTKVEKTEFYFLCNNNMTPYDINSYRISLTIRTAYYSN